MFMKMKPRLMPMTRLKVRFLFIKTLEDQILDWEKTLSLYPKEDKKSHSSTRSKPIRCGI
jgi:hypothetical protein